VSRLSLYVFFLFSLPLFDTDSLFRQVEKNPRIGDSWRRRYHTLCLHDVSSFFPVSSCFTDLFVHSQPIWADHFAGMPFPEGWTTYTPKDKLANWMELYVEAMELNVWLESVRSLFFLSFSFFAYSDSPASLCIPSLLTPALSPQTDHRAQPDLRRSDQAMERQGRPRERRRPRPQGQPPRSRLWLLRRSPYPQVPEGGVQGVPYSLERARWLPQEGLGGEEGGRYRLL
jgi:hypothetical protein